MNFRSNYFFNPTACYDLFNRSKRSLKPPVFECNTGNWLKKHYLDYEQSPLFKNSYFGKI